MTHPTLTRGTRSTADFSLIQNNNKENNESRAKFKKMTNLE